MAEGGGLSDLYSAYGGWGFKVQPGKLGYPERGYVHSLVPTWYVFIHNDERKKGVIQGR